MNEDDLCTFPGFVPPRWHPKRKKRRGKSQLRTARWMKLNEDDLCTFLASFHHGGTRSARSAEAKVNCARPHEPKGWVTGL